MTIDRDEWCSIYPIGRPIKDTQIFAFKVPFKQAILNNILPHRRLSPKMVVEKQRNLALVVDLTYTDRYYNKNDFIKLGVQYEKLPCPGKRIPSKRLVLQFFDIVDNFIKSPANNNKLIGVHCTHGINRTGYFICLYMIHRLGYSPDEAIKEFEIARKEKIYRDYILSAIRHPKHQYS